jgi:predicted RNase H-like HicB family nuclease
MEHSEIRDTLTLTVRVHHDSDGLWATVDELPGCYAAGKTIEEVQESLLEAVQLYLDLDSVGEAQWGEREESVETRKLCLT